MKAKAIIGMVLTLLFVSIMLSNTGMVKAIEVDIAPATLNVNNNAGQWITAYIEPTVMFSDNFELGWTNQQYGVWEVKAESTTNHVFEAKSDGINRGTTIFAGDTSWTDYTLEAKIYTTDTYWGVIVRADASGSTFYSTYLNTLGYAEIWKHTLGIWTRTMLAKIGGYTISSSTWYNIKVVVSGGSIQLFFKLTTAPSYPATPQASFTDPSPYLAGRIGLVFYDDPFVVGVEPDYAYYDDITVTSSSSTLFSDNFERDWTEISGQWIVEKDTTTTGVGHTLDWIYSVDRSLSPGVEAITVAGDASWTDYILEYKVKITEDGVEREGSAFVRADSLALNGYLIHPQVGGTDPGHVALWKRVSGGWTKLATAYGGITPDTWHSIKVVLQGNNIKVYVDGATTPTVEYTDTTSPFTNGRIGLRLYDNRHAHFDDVVVTDIDINDINADTIELWHSAHAHKIADVVLGSALFGDHDGDGIPDLMIKFDRATVVDHLRLEGITSGEVELIIKAEVNGVWYSDSDSVRVIAKGKVKF